VRRTEMQHNTRDQVKQYLADAAAIVAELELDGDLKVPAFEKAVDLCAGKQITFEQIDPNAIPLLGRRQG
jgi:hypothetical protein